MMTMKLITD